ncbi:endolytic peptidoglycan transglycosylase RlpA [Klebsiella pneumoniae]
MRKQWLGICIAAGLLAACSSDDVQQKTVSTPQPAVCNGPTVEISGADPQYETPNATANQDYERDGKSYKIVQDPANFTQAGFAAIYDAEPNSNLTASGEAFDPTQLTAAHPTLPIPSYARITNLANGRMIVVRINDRGPYGNDRVISLSRASADRLNTSNNTKVRIDPIIVAPDGSLSGPGDGLYHRRQTDLRPARPSESGRWGRRWHEPARAHRRSPDQQQHADAGRQRGCAGEQRRFPRRADTPEQRRAGE